MTQPNQPDEDLRLHLENRMKNLMWTVSGNYDLDVPLDVESFVRSKYIALYDAIKQGSFDKYFDRNVLALYLAKKIYLSADNNMLTVIAQLCIEAAVSEKIVTERAGVEDIRLKAFEDIIELDFADLSVSMMGRVKLALIRQYRTGEIYSGEKVIREITKKISALNETATEQKIIETIDEIYNRYIDRSFERKHGNLESVLSVTLQELRESGWEEYLKDELYDDAFEEYLNQLSVSVTNLSVQQEEKKEQTQAKESIITLDEEALARMYTYVELNYGTTYLSKAESDKINRTLCKGAHADCSLYFTDGILHHRKILNYQYKYAEKQAEKNKMAYYDHHRMIKRNIAQLTDLLKKSFLVRNQIDHIPADSGQIIPSRLWRVGKNTRGKLFNRVVKNDSLEFVVDILIDASGSQSSRQAKVAMQGYIISEALSNLKIPHRVMSFCSFWDYTILRRFRDYDEDRKVNMRLFEYMTSSNNRDGLAVKASAYTLAQRQEQNKILIVLSDGRPNDVNINRPNSRNPKPYTGDVAVNDTAFEVRKARGIGISVLGVFAGEERDLSAEKKIFGKDFAYIHNISVFSTVVGRYLSKLIDDL
jgi:nitric oxide reductase activation protein